MRPCLAPLFALVVATSGCFPQLAMPSYNPAAAQAQAHDQVDATMVNRVEQARAGAKGGGSKEAAVFAREVEGAIQAGTTGRGKLDAEALVSEAQGYLKAAVEAHADDRPMLLAVEGGLLVTAGKKAEGQKALESSLAAAPTLYPVGKLLALYAEQGKKSEVTEVCKKVRPAAKNDEERYALLDHCAVQAGGGVDEALAWASADDRSFYKAERAREQEQARRDNEAYRAKQEQERKAMHDSFSKPGASPKGGDSSGGSPAGGSGPVSVSIRSRCSKTVKVFFGQKPKFGSGTNSSVSGNSVSNHTFRPGDMMWTIDDRENGLASVTVGPGTREIEVGADCRSLSAR